MRLDHPADPEIRMSITFPIPKTCPRVRRDGPAIRDMGWPVLGAFE
jgi:hypothetical protein